jgi:hypothetical protein
MCSAAFGVEVCIDAAPPPAVEFKLVFSGDELAELRCLHSTRQQYRYQSHCMSLVFMTTAKNFSWLGVPSQTGKTMLLMEAAGVLEMLDKLEGDHINIIMCTCHPGHFSPCCPPFLSVVTL